jgi:hypothetical protein
MRVKMKDVRICENCRAGNHRECQIPIALSSTQEGKIKKTSIVCCDDATNWEELGAK